MISDVFRESSGHRGEGEVCGIGIDFGSRRYNGLALNPYRNVTKPVHGKGQGPLASHLGLFRPTSRTSTPSLDSPHGCTSSGKQHATYEPRAGEPTTRPRWTGFMLHRNEGNWSKKPRRMACRHTARERPQPYVTCKSARVAT